MKKAIRIIILIIAVGVFGFSLFKVISGENEYKEGRDEYEDIREEAKTDDPDAGNGIDWDALRAINPDIVGWIRFKEPKVIDYPVVQGKDNSTYLKKSFGANYIKAGTIFINCDNTPDFGDWNTIIYGHNMNDGSMFASLKRQYQDKAFWEQYPDFEIYTPDGATHRYKIFAVGTYKAGSEPSGQYQFTDAIDFMDLINQIKAGQAYETGVEVTEENRIVTLYTCTNVRAADRWLVFGVEQEN